MKFSHRIKDITDMVVHNLYSALSDEGIRDVTTFAKTDDEVLCVVQAISKEELDRDMPYLLKNYFQAAHQTFIRLFKKVNKSQAAWVGARVRPYRDGIVITMLITFTEVHDQVCEESDTMYECWLRFYP